MTIPARRLRSLIGLLFTGLSGCRAAPPPLWAQGGAPLMFSASTWTQIDGSQLRLDVDGSVWQDGEHIYSLDRAGRVVDDSNDPVALLTPDGQLFGTDQAYWGRVGVHNAAPPWGPEAWLHVTQSGQVVLFDADGETVGGGRWNGCQGPTLRTCTLLTHLALLESVQMRQSNPSLYLGVGVGYMY